MSAKNVIEMNPEKMVTAKGGARTVLVPKTSITFQTCGEVQSKFEEYLNERKNEIILDLKSVPFIDSAGLELLVRMNEELKNRGGLLKLVSPSETCRDILIATRLINSMHIYEDIHAAIMGRE